MQEFILEIGFYILRDLESLTIDEKLKVAEKYLEIIDERMGEVTVLDSENAKIIHDLK